MSHHILFIFNQIPESTDYYLIPLEKLPETIRGWMEKANHFSINGDDASSEDQETAVEFLQMAISEDNFEIKHFAYETPKGSRKREERIEKIIVLPEEYRHILPKFKVKDPKIELRNVNITDVFVLNFLM